MEKVAILISFVLFFSLIDANQKILLLSSFDENHEFSIRQISGMEIGFDFIIPQTKKTTS